MNRLAILLKTKISVGRVRNFDGSNGIFKRGLESRNHFLLLELESFLSITIIKLIECEYESPSYPSANIGLELINQRRIKLGLAFDKMDSEKIVCANKFRKCVITEGVFLSSANCLIYCLKGL